MSEQARRCRPADRSSAIALGRVLLICASLLMSVTALPQNADLTAAFDQANALYAQGKFSEAAEKYKTLLGSGHTSPAVLFNLGNAYFKAGQLGKAIAAYRTSQARAPRDPDVQANLRFARNRVQGPTLTIPAWQRMLGRLSLNEWAVAASVALWLCLLLLATGQFRPAFNRALRPYLVASALIFLILAGCTWMALRITRAPLAIVTAAEATVRQAPLDDSESAFVVHDGAELRVLDAKGDWLQVTPNGKRIGWVNRSQVLAAPGA